MIGELPQNVFENRQDINKSAALNESLWLCDLPVLRFLCIEFEADPSKSSLRPLRCRILWIFCESRLRWRPGGFIR